ncbi:hypothetical protein B2A_11243, partial [mine drainage metagenome]
EITKFGVGQAAVEMAFQTSLRFPETFILERIQGEEPLYVYTIDLTDVLTKAELSANVVQKDYQFEKDEIRNKFIDYNVSSESIDGIITKFDAQQRTMKVSELISALEDAGMPTSEMVMFLKSMGIEDTMISRIMNYAGKNGR